MMTTVLSLFGTTFVLQIISTFGSSCPSGAEYCLLNYDYLSNDIFPYKTVVDAQECVDYCKPKPGCVGAAYVLFLTPRRCYCKYSLGGPGNAQADVNIYAFANNTAVKTCGTTSLCDAMHRIKSYRVGNTIYCGDTESQIDFGDFNGDGICDVVCWNPNTGATNWAQGSEALKFISPSGGKSLGVFCDSTSKIEVRDTNDDGKDDLVCIGVDMVMRSDNNGLSASQIDSFDPLENVPVVEECVPSCESFSISNAIVTYDVNETKFEVKCDNGYTLRGNQFVGCAVNSTRSSQYTAPFPFCRETRKYVKYDLFMGKALVPLQSTRTAQGNAFVAYAIVAAKGSLDCASKCHSDSKCLSAEFESKQCRLFQFKAAIPALMGSGSVSLLIATEDDD